MGKQHELLAVEKNLKNESLRRFKEGTDTFQKRSNHFQGFIKTFDSVKEDTEMEVLESSPIVETVDEKLDFIFEAAEKAVDIVLQKEKTNQIANADILINGDPIATNIPATTLLGLESTLQEWKKVLMTIPTLDPSLKWALDETRGCFTVESAPKTAQEKSTEWQVVAPPTKEHKAQVKEIVIIKELGTVSRNNSSSMYTVSHKAEILSRIDVLINEVKKARCRANNTDVVTASIGKTLTDFILGN